MNNNYWPPRMEPTRFQLYKQKERFQQNPMQIDKRVKLIEGLNEE